MFKPINHSAIERYKVIRNVCWKPARAVSQIEGYVESRMFLVRHNRGTASPFYSTHQEQLDVRSNLRAQPVGAGEGTTLNARLKEFLAIESWMASQGGTLASLGCPEPNRVYAPDEVSPTPLPFKSLGLVRRWKQESTYGSELEPFFNQFILAWESEFACGIEQTKGLCNVFNHLCKLLLMELSLTEQNAWWDVVPRVFDRGFYAGPSKSMIASTGIEEKYWFQMMTEFYAGLPRANLT